MAMVGLVVVSHSRALAEAAVALALEMVQGDPPAVEVAAGMPDGGFGTDATAVMEAVERADAGAGVVVLVDLGSAIMSAEMALEFLDSADSVRVVPAPFVEGLLAAVVMAAGGESVDAVAAEARGALTPKLEALGDEPAPAADPQESSPAEVTQTVEVVNRAGLHARPAAQLASLASQFDAEVQVSNQRTGRSARPTPIGLATLTAQAGDTLQIAASGPQAQDAVSALVDLVAGGFGEDTGEPASPGTDAQPQPAPTPDEDGSTDAPRGVSPGRVVGVARQMETTLAEPPVREISDVPAEQKRAAAALRAVADDFRSRSAGASGEAGDILAATADLAEDPTLVEAASEQIQQHRVGAETAVWRACDEVAQTLREAGGVIAERATDLTDIRNRTVARLTGARLGGLPDQSQPYVLVARDLAPADTAALNPATCLALVTAEGGPTSHTSILARSLGIPAVVGARSALRLPEGTTVLVDGSTGEVIANPTKSQTKGARTEPAGPVRLEKPGRTADGTAVPLLANVGSARDAERAAQAGAEGVGLFRTEFCFLDRDTEPSVEEQVQAYRPVFEAFPQKRVVIRTLDAGSDKPLPFLTADDEPNPALGVRGFRTAWQRPDVLERQLQAIASAAQGTEADVWVMAPMIATADEAAEFTRLARGMGLQNVGVMIETPSAAVCAARVLAHVDFVSLGTNDLAQYTMAADRQLPGLSHLIDAHQPAVLRMIGLAGEAGHRLGKPVGVCGEAASDPSLAPVLVGLGITSLSMGPAALPAVQEALAGHTLQECTELAARAAGG